MSRSAWRVNITGYNGSAWVLATYSGGEVKYGGDVKLTITTVGGVTYHTLPNGIKLGSDGSISLPDTIEETAKKTQITAGTDYLIGYIEAGSVVIRMENRQGSLLDDDTDDLDIYATGNVVFMTESSGSIGTPSNLLEIEAANVYYYNLAGEDIVSTDTYIYVPEGDIILGWTVLTVKGCTLLIEVPNGSLFGNDLYVTDASTVTIDAFGNIEFDNVTVDENSLLNMIAGESIIINVKLDVDDSTLDFNAASGGISMPLFYSDNSTATFDAGSDVDIGGFTANGSTVDITTGGGFTSDTWSISGSDVDLDAGGDVGIGDFAAESGSKVGITAGGGFTSDTWSITGSGVDLAAGGDVGIGDFTAENNSTVGITAGGGFTSDTWSVSDSDVDLAAGGDVGIGEFTAESGSTVGITAGGGFTSDTWSVSDSDVDLEADGDVGIGDFSAEDSTIDITAGGGYSSDTWTASGSTVNITAGGVINVPDVDIQGSTASMIAGGDINFDIFNGSDSDISLISTGGGIYAADGDSYIKVTGTGSALTLSALEDIGTADLHIRMDIPAEVVLHILHVDDYYIDAMIIPVPDPPDDPVYTGTDEYGNPVTNDGEIPNEYVGSIGAETVTIDFDSLTAEEWAQRLMGAMTREEWLALIADGSVGDLILAGSIDAELLSEYLFDDTITPESVEALLTVDPATPEWQDTLDWLAATETALRELLVTTEGMTPTKTNKEVITDEMAEALVALFINNNFVGEIDPTLVLTAEEIAQLAAQIAANLAEQAAATLSTVDNEARALGVLVGESTGAAWVTNEGDINITQQTGNMTVGLIDSTRGDVSLTTLDAAEGDIRGADTGATHIEARNIVLSAAGSIDLVIDEISNRLVAVYNILDTRFVISNAGTLEAPVIIGRLESDVRYDWLRIWDCDEATRLDAAAGGSIDIIEARGDSGIGIISAGGAVTLAAEFGIYDTTDNGETDKNITGASLVMTAPLGGIGTADKYIDTSVADFITATAQGDIFVTDTGDMEMTADSLGGQVNTETEDDMILRNTTGDLRLGIVLAGGFAEITSAGSIVEDDRRGALATITADGMALEANGDIGTAENPFEIDHGQRYVQREGEHVVRHRDQRRFKA